MATNIEDLFTFVITIILAFISYVYILKSWIDNYGKVMRILVFCIITKYAFINYHRDAK